MNFSRSALSLACLPLLFGCAKTLAPNAPAASPSTAQPAHYPAPPSVPAPTFRLFHHTTNTFTLVTAPDATDQQIAAILYKLRDAAQAHSFDSLGIPQKLVDARDPIAWFYIYRGPQCASEKYAAGKPPCGASYHAAGAFTYGDFKNHDRTEALLLANTNTHGDGAETPLWNPEATH